MATDTVKKFTTADTFIQYVIFNTNMTKVMSFQISICLSVDQCNARKKIKRTLNTCYFTKLSISLMKKLLYQ